VKFYVQIRRPLTLPIVSWNSLHPRMKKAARRRRRTKTSTPESGHVSVFRPRRPEQFVPKLKRPQTARWFLCKFLVSVREIDSVTSPRSLELWSWIAISTRSGFQKNFENQFIVVWTSASTKLMFRVERAPLPRLSHPQPRSGCVGQQQALQILESTPSGHGIPSMRLSLNPVHLSASLWRMGRSQIYTGIPTIRNSPRTDTHSRMSHRRPACCFCNRAASHCKKECFPHKIL